MSERMCLNCRSDISHRDARAKYCSKKCLDAPRFYGTYCDWCKKELFVARGNLKLTRFCSKRCVFLFKHPDLNESYFAEPNLENSYWAGLIAADGCIYSGRNNRQKEMSLGLQEADSEHLEILMSMIGGGNTYHNSYCDSRTGKTYHRVDYRIPSDKICSDLALNFNIHPRKSLTHEPPRLEGDLAIAFIAGYIDGDGSYTHGRRRPRLSLVGTKQFLFWASNILGAPRDPSFKSDSSIYCIEFSGDCAIEIRNLFRSLDLPLLKRKRDRWEELGLDLSMKRKI